MSVLPIEQIVVKSLDMKRPILQRHPGQTPHITLGDPCNFLKLQVGAVLLNVKISALDVQRLLCAMTAGEDAESKLSMLDMEHGYDLEGYPPEAQDRV